VFYSNGQIINVYIGTNCLEQTQIEELFGYVESSGYGKNASTGKGQIGDVVIEETDLPGLQGANAFVSLSDFVPDKDFPRNGWYNLVTKQGKTGPGISSNAGPFKKRMIMLGQGATFIDKYSTERRYGCILRDIHPDNRIVHFAAAYPMWVKVEEEDLS